MKVTFVTHVSTRRVTVTGVTLVSRASHLCHAHHAHVPRDYALSAACSLVNHGGGMCYVVFLWGGHVDRYRAHGVPLGTAEFDYPRSTSV